MYAQNNDGREFKTNISTSTLFEYYHERGCHKRGAEVARGIKRCVKTNLILNWEKCHFMVTKDIILGHKIFSRDIQFDKEKVEVTNKLPPPSNIKGIKSFISHARFYRRLIKEFYKISKPLSNQLNKDNSFKFDNLCLHSFKSLEEKLVIARIIITRDWTLKFELTCDVSDYKVSVILGQRKTEINHDTHYASKVLNDDQVNYAITENEFLAIVHTLEKFRSYLTGSKIIMYTDNAHINYLMTNSDSKPKLII